ncbi:hypothetical protein [Streptococcus sp. S784/96/1]|uniref:hypothetical protein n=1 Tax=Streptococcus sp. S784/96/1 TaxID=2653499 RepID=UPI0013893F4F|nr:hypothetical protein [Streptococcus sp. S784/96/1]
MLKVLIKRNVTQKQVIKVLLFFILLHLSGKALLDVDFPMSVLHYYHIEHCNFYLIVKYLLPLIVYLYLFVGRIDLAEDDMSLVIIRTRKKYEHLKAISLYILLTGTTYWLFYFLSFIA